MSRTCCGDTGGDAIRRNAILFRITDGLALAASPTFAIMALTSSAPAENTLLGGTRLAAEWNGHDVRVDDRLSYGAVAEAGPDGCRAFGLRDLGRSSAKRCHESVAVIMSGAGAKRTLHPRQRSITTSP